MSARRPGARTREIRRRQAAGDGPITAVMVSLCTQGAVLAAGLRHLPEN